MTSPTATCTKPLSANEIFRSLPPSYNIARPILDQYLTLLVDDPVWSSEGTRRYITYIRVFVFHEGFDRSVFYTFQMEFVGKAGESGGGMYVVSILFLS